MPEENKGLRNIEKMKDQPRKQGNNYLFVIGIDEYKNFPKLNNAVRDAKDFADIMCHKYGYSKDFYSFIGYYVFNEWLSGYK